MPLRPMFCACLTALFAVSAPAFAQRAAVVTNTLSPTRQAAALHVHQVDFSAPDAAAVGPPQALPGIALTGPLTLDPSGRLAVASTRFAPPYGIFPDFFTTFAATLRMEPVLHERSLAIQGGAYEELRAACFVDSSDGPPLLALLAARGGDHALEVYRMDGEARRHAAWPLPGRPLLAEALPDGAVAVLCRTEAGDAALHVRRAFTGEVLTEALSFPLTSLAAGPHPAAAAAAPDLGALLVAVSGYSFDTPLGTPETHIFLIDIPTLRVVGRVRAPGLAAPHGIVRQGDAFWIATHTPSDRFGHVGRYEIVGEGLRLDAQYSFGGAAAPPKVAPDPRSSAVAVASGDSLEVWPAGRPGPSPRRFGQPIAALRWADEGLIAAEADRLHLLSETGATSRRVLRLLSGVVADLLVLPSEGLAADEAPAKRPALELDLPYVRLFSAAAAGRELQTAIVSAEGEASAWGLDPETVPPWLLVQPLGGERLPAVLHLMVNPARYGDPAQTRSARLAVWAEGADESGAALSARAEMAVHVLPQSSPLHRILWIWDAPREASFRDPSDPLQLRALAETLAAPPHLFIHEETSIPVLTPLSEYRVVVLTARAAAAGAVTRQAALEYVANGGALLLLGEHLPESARPLAPWLSPLGITIDAATAVSGRFGPGRADSFARGWNVFEIAGGAYLRSSRPESILVPGEDVERGDAVLIAQEYGYGRLAVLAGPTPLQTAAMSRADNRRFASALLRWLVRAGRDVRDLSQDGLLEWIRDTQTRAAWSGEASEADDGLTSLPTPGPPRLATGEPSSGPAEGGTVVALSGDALTLDAEAWFGERSAPVRPDPARPNTLLAVTPPSPGLAPGPVDVRIMDPRSGLETHLPGGFEYTSRSVVSARLALLEQVQAAGRRYEGGLTVTISRPAQTALAAVEITFEADPPQAVSWTRIALRENPPGRLVSLDTGDMTLPLWLTNLEETSGDLVLDLAWQIPGRYAEERPVTLNVTRFRPTTPQGVVLDVDVRPQRLPIAGTAPTPRRAGTD